jgi:hypothetical protein
VDFVATIEMTPTLLELAKAIAANEENSVLEQSRG